MFYYNGKYAEVVDSSLLVGRVLFVSESIRWYHRFSTLHCPHVLWFSCIDNAWATLNEIHERRTERQQATRRLESMISQTTMKL
jgi:hypothetical protein